MDPFPNDLPGTPEPLDTRAAREAVSVPAILLMVAAGLEFLQGLYGLVKPQGEAQDIDPEALDKLREAHVEFLIPLFEGLQGGARYFNLITLAIAGLMFWGAWRMRELRSYGLAMTSAIIAVIPCCGPCYCLAIPLGIWALVVLAKPEVKSAFRP
mgnify:CR=1 FL=1